MSSLSRMRLVFIATGDIALPSFRRLLAGGPRPLALVTQPDKPAGRHQTPKPPRIRLEAQAAGIPVLQPLRSSDCADDLRALAPEVIVVMAYGQILRDDLLALPSLAIINLHASLLPRHRGAACIQSAIDAGDRESGITSMHVTRELDAGDVILARAIPIVSDETGGSLHDRLADLAADVLMDTLQRLAAGDAPRVPQDPALATHVPKLMRDHGRIDWSMSATAIERRIRAYDPWPGTHARMTADGRSMRLKIFPPARVMERDAAGALPTGESLVRDGRWFVGCGDGRIELLRVQPEGARRMEAAEFLRGHTPGRME